jgi:hypothetical protein
MKSWLIIVDARPDVRRVRSWKIPKRGARATRDERARGGFLRAAGCVDAKENPR